MHIIFFNRYFLTSDVLFATNSNFKTVGKLLNTPFQKMNSYLSLVLVVLASGSSAGLVISMKCGLRTSFFVFGNSKESSFKHEDVDLDSELVVPLLREVDPSSLVLLKLCRKKMKTIKRYHVSQTTTSQIQNRE